MRGLITVITVGVVAVFLYNAVVIATALYRGGELARSSKAFTKTLSDADHRVLVVGDSTAVGTGASSPADSIAGRIATDYPGTAIVNRARDGVLTEAVPDQIASAQNGPFDLVLVQVGGNDALRFTSQNALREAIHKTLEAAAAKGERTLLVSVGDLGQAPAVPWPLSLLFSHRSQMVRDVFREAAERNGAQFLDLMAVKDAANPFLKDPDTYYARDKLHPASAGYAQWYENLRASVPLDQWLGPFDPATGR